MCSLIGGLVICSPLIGVYYGVKWIINHTPSKVKKKKEQDLEIHKLEQKLGLIGRDNKALHYDPHYYKNRNENRNDYLVDLRRKVNDNYSSPDIITVINTFESFIFDEDFECNIIVMIHKDYYNIRTEKDCKFLERADFYFNLNVSSHVLDRLSTLSECGRYSDYYVISVPRKFQRKEVMLETGEFAEFINDFKKINKKN